MGEKPTYEELEQRVRELERETHRDKQAENALNGLLPICSSCKKIRDSRGYWHTIEAYISRHCNAEFSHSICPDCAKRIYPDWSIHDD